MVELEDESVAFPVVLYDGDREMDVGNISIRPQLNFKQFQKMLKEIVGISYNNLTTYFVGGDVSKIPSERRKVLVTGKVNFAVIVLEKNCYFLVVLKRSRRDRRRKDVSKQIPFAPIVSVSPAHLLQLHRNHNNYHVDLQHLIDERVSFGRNLYGYEDPFQDFQMMKENYLSFNPPLNSNFPSVQGGGSRELCKDCARAEKQGIKAAFHFCVYDDVVAGGFRSPVGPISRPA